MKCTHAPVYYSKSHARDRMLASAAARASTLKQHPKVFAGRLVVVQLADVVAREESDIASQVALPPGVLLPLVSVLRWGEVCVPDRHGQGVAAGIEASAPRVYLL